MAVAAGIEPTTCSLGESRSIQLSYATASKRYKIILYSRFSENQARMQEYFNTSETSANR